MRIPEEDIAKGVAKVVSGMLRAGPYTEDDAHRIAGEMNAELLAEFRAEVARVKAIHDLCGATPISDELASMPITNASRRNGGATTCLMRSLTTSTTGNTGLADRILAMQPSSLADAAAMVDVHLTDRYSPQEDGTPA